MPLMELPDKRGNMTTDQALKWVRQRNHYFGIEMLLFDAEELPDDLEASLYAYREQVMKARAQLACELTQDAVPDGAA